MRWFDYVVLVCLGISVGLLSIHYIHSSILSLCVSAIGGLVVGYGYGSIRRALG